MYIPNIKTPIEISTEEYDNSDDTM